SLATCPAPNGEIFTCTINPGVSIPGGTALKVRLNGLMNPDTPGNYGFGALTSRDTQATALFHLDAATTGGAVTLAAAFSNAAGARTQWSLGFVNTGALSAAAGSQITLTFPANVDLSTMVGGAVFVGATQLGSCTHSGVAVTCVLANGQS